MDDIFKKSSVKNTLEIGKIPPQATDTEEVVLGALLLEKDAIYDVLGLLVPDSFYKDSHQKIYRAIIELHNKEIGIDIITVTNELRNSEELESIGGSIYLGKLTNRVAGSGHIKYHARIIQQKFIQREIIRVTSEIQEKAFDDNNDAQDLLDYMNNEVGVINEYIVKGKEVRNFSDNVDEAIANQKIKQKAIREGKQTGVKTPLHDLNKVTGGWQKSDMIVLAARPSMGKCLGLGTKVIMYDGTLRNVEDVKVGDLLMGDDSTPREVKSLARGREMMYWVRQIKGIDYRVNESHILSLKRSRNEYSKKHGEVENVSVLDYLSKSNKWKSNFKGYKVPIEFSEKPLIVEPYFMGLWLGDGCENNSRITNPDKEVHNYLKDYSERLGYNYSVYSKEDKCPTLTIKAGVSINRKNDSIQAILNKLNLLGNKHIPEDYLLNNKHNRLQLLAGLIDSDGYVNKKGGNIEITQKSEKLAYQIKYLCDTLGYRTSIKEKIGFKGCYWHIRFNGNVDEIPTKIKRKKCKEWTDKRDWTMTGVTLEKDKIDDYYGFEIDGNRLFLLEDCTVTHNTAFMLDVAKEATKVGESVVIFSLEMATEQLTNRIILSETNVEPNKVRSEQLSKPEMEDIEKAAVKVRDYNIYIDDNVGIGMNYITSRCNVLRRKGRCDLVIIDYLQLMESDKKGLSREQEISQISRKIKTLAKSLNIPIIALSQLNRSVELTPTKKPNLSHLRESGAIEQDADMVLFIFRPAVYSLFADEEGDLKGKGEMIIAKHREGALKDIPFEHNEYVNKFWDYVPEGQRPNSGQQELPYKAEEGNDIPF